MKVSERTARRIQSVCGVSLPVGISLAEAFDLMCEKHSIDANKVFKTNMKEKTFIPAGRVEVCDMRWFEEKRREWILAFIARNGRINRKDIMSEFGISSPQASTDLGKLRVQFPDLLVYDFGKKQWRARETERVKP